MYSRRRNQSRTCTGQWEIYKHGNKCKNRMHGFANVINPYCIHNGTQGTYWMFSRKMLTKSSKTVAKTKLQIAS